MIGAETKLSNCADRTRKTITIAKANTIIPPDAVSVKVAVSANGMIRCPSGVTFAAISKIRAQAF